MQPATIRSLRAQDGTRQFVGYPDDDRQWRKFRRRGAQPIQTGGRCNAAGTISVAELCPKPPQMTGFGQRFFSPRRCKAGFGLCQTGCSCRIWALFPAWEISAAFVPYSISPKRFRCGPLANSQGTSRIPILGCISRKGNVRFPVPLVTPQACRAAAAASPLTGNPTPRIPGGRGIKGVPSSGNAKGRRGDPVCGDAIAADPPAGRGL